MPRDVIVKAKMDSCCDRHSHSMTPFPEVRKEFLSLIQPVTGETKVALEASAGRVLSKDFIAEFPLPQRDNSAVDGYALGLPDETGTYRIRARTAAGEAAQTIPLATGQADRIFTGAPVPEGTATVAMQEDVAREQNRISLTVPAGTAQNIRRKGEDIKIGDVLIPAGTHLDPRHVALLAAMGQAMVQVVSPVRVALLSSGKELCDPGEPLGAASIHDSNRWMLKSLLRSSRVKVDDLGILPDDQSTIARIVADAASRNDLILSTGGVSVGEEDHIFAAMEEIGANPVQRHMAIKPGKPVVFGRAGQAISLGLPGNPVAALVSFQLLAQAAISRLSGARILELEPVAAVAGFDWQRSAGRVEYFPAQRVGFTSDGHPVLSKLGKAGSARLSPLIEADGLARVSDETTNLSEGDKVDWFPFQGGFAL